MGISLKYINLDINTVESWKNIFLKNENIKNHVLTYDGICRKLLDAKNLRKVEFTAKILGKILNLTPKFWQKIEFTASITYDRKKFCRNYLRQFIIFVISWARLTFLS